LKTLKQTGWWGDEQVGDTGKREMNNWDEYTPSYDGDDHLGDFYQESENKKIGEDKAAKSVRRLLLKNYISLPLERFKLIRSHCDYNVNFWQKECKPDANGESEKQEVM
jgi:hypothetical protein